MIISLRYRYIIFLLIFCLLTLSLLTLHISYGPLTSLIPQPPTRSPPPGDKPKLKQHPLYKPPKSEKIPSPLPEYFPLAASAKTSADLPPVPRWNQPPEPHLPEKTRLYIGFTRYWPLLQQVVVSYITAGWPPEDIYVVENTGTFDANKNGLLTSQNPFYLDYHRLTVVFGVNVLTTPSLQSFAQLQNLYLSEAVNNNLSCYFWAHMDTVPQAHEDVKPYKSLYHAAVDVMRESMAPGYKDAPWAVRFFSYDWLVLVNVEAFVKVGGWDTMISYYGTDCDMHNRLRMNGLSMEIADGGKVYDVGKSLPDLEVLYRRKKKSGKAKRVEKTTVSPFDEGIKAILAADDGVREVANDKGEDQASGRTFDDGMENVTIGKDNLVTYRAKAADNATTGPVAAPDTAKPAAAAPLITTVPMNKKYLSETEEDTLGSENWKELQDTLEAMAEEKRRDPYRNSWQLEQRGGKGEPYHYDPDGWEKALQMTIEQGGRIMEEKWGHKGCDLQEVGLKEGDQWRVDHDWD